MQNIKALFREEKINKTIENLKNNKSRTGDKNGRKI